MTPRTNAKKRLRVILWRRARGSSEAIRTWYAGCFAGYSLIGPSVFQGWSNVAAVGCILIAVPLVVVSATWRSAPRDPLLSLLRPAPHADDLLADEIERADAHDLQPWWISAQHGARWFDDFFAFWWKAPGLPAESIAITCTRPELTPKSFAGIPDSLPQNPEDKRKKAALLEASPFWVGGPAHLECCRIDYAFGSWVGMNGKEFRKNNPEASSFGIEGWRPYPSILVTHNVVMTADRWILMCLRSTRTEYFPNTWSVGFEEQVEVGPTPTDSQWDRSVGAAVRRGLSEEFGSEVANSVRAMHTVALGREFVETESMSVRNAGLITVVELQCDLATVWSALSVPGRIPDVAEHQTWMALRFDHVSDVATLLRRFPPRSHRGLSAELLRRDRRLTVEVAIPPFDARRSATDFGWHPTSRPRLLLWAEWASHNDLLRSKATD